jgi:hypothetical protein
MQNLEHDALLAPPSKTAPRSSRRPLSVRGVLTGILPPGLAIGAFFVAQLPPPPSTYPGDLSGLVFLMYGYYLFIAAYILSFIGAVSTLMLAYLREPEHRNFPRGLFIGLCFGWLAGLIFYWWPSLIITISSDGPRILQPLLFFTGLVTIPLFLAIPPLFLHRKRHVPEKAS